jgi:adenylosuccinate synthase
MILDLQYGSTGKGLIAGYLATREKPDTVACAFATNAGHTYIDESRGMHIMTQQIPTAILASPECKVALIGPGALVHRTTFLEEVRRYGHLLKGKKIMIHPHAAVVEDYHGKKEADSGYTKIGSTAKGVGEAAIERIRRHPEDPNVAGWRWSPDTDPEMGEYVCTKSEYDDAVRASENLMVEGAQGFGLSMYHGFYPYTTSRDVTPWQTAADCGLPYKLASYIKVVGTMRTFPIRVNNRDGWSGPSYPDQYELGWEHFEKRGIAAELTTVTKLKRRIFTFSRQQAIEAAYHCGGYWDTRLFLNFANYCENEAELQRIIHMIEEPSPEVMNPPRVCWLGHGPDDGDIQATGA